MTIREVEVRLDVTRANVRFYEKEGLVLPKRNPLNDYREYSEEDVRLLEKILFLRKLDIPIEKIRLLQRREAAIKEVLVEQEQELEKKKEQAEEALIICRSLLKEEKLSFEQLSIPLQKGEGRASFMDTLNDLWNFWDKLVVWGFLALQVFYTLIVFPLLPEQIPTEYKGSIAVKFQDRGYFFYYLIISVLLVYAMRIILYRYLAGGLRCYLDEINAVLTIGGILAGFSQQVHTVLFLLGAVKMGQDTFLIGCGFCYIILVLLIGRFCVRRREEPGEGTL